VHPGVMDQLKVNGK